MPNLLYKNHDDATIQQKFKAQVILPTEIPFAGI